MNHRFLALARLDVFALAEFFEDRQTGLGDRVIDAVEARAVALGRQPHSGGGSTAARAAAKSARCLSDRIPSLSPTKSSRMKSSSCLWCTGAVGVSPGVDIGRD